MEKYMQFIEQERINQKIHKNKLCSLVDITPQYYDLLVKGKSKPNFLIVIGLIKALGYDLAIIKPF